MDNILVSERNVILRLVICFVVLVSFLGTYTFSHLYNSCYTYDICNFAVDAVYYFFNTLCVTGTIICYLILHKCVL